MWNMFKVKLWTYSSVSIVNFEQVNVGWVCIKLQSIRPCIMLKNSQPYVTNLAEIKKYVLPFLNIYMKVVMILNCSFHTECIPDQSHRVFNESSDKPIPGLFSISITPENLLLNLWFCMKGLRCFFRKPLIFETTRNKTSNRKLYNIWVILHLNWAVCEFQEQSFY